MNLQPIRYAAFKACLMGLGIEFSNFNSFYRTDWNSIQVGYEVGHQLKKPWNLFMIEKFKIKTNLIVYPN
jgi:hypothetical protein